MFIVGLLECFFLVNKNLVRASSCGILVAVNRQTDTARPGALATALRRLCCRAGVDAAAPPPDPRAPGGPRLARGRAASSALDDAPDPPAP